MFDLASKNGTFVKLRVNDLLLLIHGLSALLDLVLLTMQGAQL